MYVLALVHKLQVGGSKALACQSPEAVVSTCHETKASLASCVYFPTRVVQSPAPALRRLWHHLVAEAVVRATTALGRNNRGQHEAHDDADATIAGASVAAAAAVCRLCLRDFTSSLVFAATSTTTTTPTQDCAHAQAGNCPQWNGQAKREGGWSKAEHRAHDGSSTAADPAVGRTNGSGGTCRRTFLLQENSRKVAEGRDTAARGTLEGSHAGLLLSGPTPWFGHRWICPL
eukprot:CAMPEP_0204167438 /NCGR_PEP_ID=MMETSP0361-20130328/39866_1 /ASSEMBLY_ACC=CAM_ASM_000343 /TAXON_ID=268821 /ORGANISM="Scrippsiella Hangoei, Strain SHTV-5" /LENGTH=230 /DNA_ID=CAMNT_0051124743 /DNA_START=17 /DNA_END=709 /DNA_ORIENTATION=-